MMYAEGDYRRQVMGGDKQAADYRSPFGRDYGRVIHSASFRRLQGKTQVFPGHESDFFRNRLTHSLEVAQIAEGIAERINFEFLPDKKDQIDARLCAVAGLVHDIGHPPFGHNGERALDAEMVGHGGFEGNAQTLRILARIEKKVQYEGDVGGDNRAGMNLTHRTLAAILKYDREIALVRPLGDKVKKGYYASERPIVDAVKSAVMCGQPLPDAVPFKTVECQIMDLADDFAYSVYDLEDCLKAGFLTPASILASSDALLEEVAKAVSKQLGEECTPSDVITVFAELFSDQFVSSSDGDAPNKVLDFIKSYQASHELSESSYLRTRLSSALVHEFIAGVKFEHNAELPMLSRAYIDGYLKMKVEVLKQYTFVAMIYSARVKLGEYRGIELVGDIFKALIGDKGHLLMPDDVRRRFLAIPEAEEGKRARTVCDFVAGMTDRYAMEFWARLKSDGAESMFKPI